MASQFFHSNENDGTLLVQGDLDVYSVRDAIEQGCRLIKLNESFTVIDLGQVGKMDSAGLAFVIELMRVAKKYKKSLRFNNIPARMHVVADVYGLSGVIPDNAFQSA